MSDIRKKAAAGLEAGDTFSISRTFTERDVIDFAEITRDYNPVHFDHRFAEAKKFDARICHGLLVGGMLTEIGGQIGWLAAGMSFRFKKPVYPGDRIECRFTITEIDDRGHAVAEVLFQNQDKITVLEATLTGIIPGPQEREVLKAMLAEGDPSNKVG